MKQIIDQIVQFFFDAAVSGRVRQEGQMTTVDLSGGEGVDRITGYVGKACQSAIDRSVEGSALGPEERLPAANNLMVALYIEHEKGVRFSHVTDTADLARNLSRALTEYAHKQKYLVAGNRVDVLPISVRDIDGTGRERIEVFWKRSEPLHTDARAVDIVSPSSKPANEPSQATVKGSDKITAESSEDEARLSEPFQLWVKDGREAPRAWEYLLTPFYFGRQTRHPQVDFDFAQEDQISRDHFAILYLPRERFLIRNNGRNGTVVVRGERAVRLYTPPSVRDRAGSAKIARLAEGDIIRLQAGPLYDTKIVQMAFVKPGTPVDGIRWADSLADIDCADAIDPVVRRVRENGPPEQYTLICGEQYLGSAVTQGVKFSYSEEDPGFVGGRALAVVTNFGGVMVRWLRDDIRASAGATMLPTGVDVPLKPGDELSFGNYLDGIAATKLLFEWSV